MKNKVNFFDFLIILIIFLLLGVALGAYYKGDRVYSDKIRITFEAVGGEQVFEAVKIEKEVYFNSINKPVNVRSVEKNDETIKIILEAPGEKRSDYFIFNGQRILLNQKTEIHDTFFLQGKITSIEYAN